VTAPLRTRARDTTTSRGCNACFHSTWSVTTKHSDFNPDDYKCISRGCTTLMNWSRFAMCLAWRWPDHHWQCNWRLVWTSSRICVQAKGVQFEQLLWHYSAIWQEFLSNVTWFLDSFFCIFCKLPQIRTSDFRKVVWQYTEGVIGSILWLTGHHHSTSVTVTAAKFVCVNTNLLTYLMLEI